MLALTLAGLLMGACFAGMAMLRHLQAQTVSFLVLYGLACAGFGAALWIVRRDRPGRKALPLIVGLGLLFRTALLFTTPPTLSDDVYRYIWDGRLADAGVSPYAHAVHSPLLDRFDSPVRALVNNDWMASPYLPAAQALFAAVYRLAPDSPLAFQVAAVLFDLLTGWMVVDLLRRLDLPREGALLYFWHPLVIVEFAHGAHVDALMVCLMVASLWALIALRSRLLSAVALAAATLTKGLPALLLPVLGRRWRWPYVLLYLAAIVLACLPFGLRAGWGLSIPPGGEGLFGALLIYGAYWNFNGGLYHWLEVLFSGYFTPDPVPQEAVGWLPIYAAKAVAALGLGGILYAVWKEGRRCVSDRGVLCLALVPLAGYLLLAPTVHPWYATWLVPLLPFLGRAPLRRGSIDACGDVGPGARHGDGASRGVDVCLGRDRWGAFLWPLLYLTLVLPLSYLSYLDPAQPRELALVRALEYVPAFLLLIWAARQSFRGAGRQTA